MNDVMEQISLYGNLYQICLGLALLFLIVSVTVFFVLDIRSTIEYLTGRRARKQIQKLEETNQESGRMITRSRSMQYVDQQMQKDMGIPPSAAPGVRRLEHVAEPAGADGEAPASSERSTAFLQQPTEQDLTADLPQAGKEEEAAVGLGDKRKQNSDTRNPDATVRLAGRKGQEADGITGDESQPAGRFVIVRELMLIHTEEVI